MKELKLWAAGGVIINKLGNEVVLCHRQKESLWTLPKGKPKKNETIEQTALREVNEETGLKVEIVSKIGKIEYAFSRKTNSDKTNYKKIVHWYLMHFTGGNFQFHDNEFDLVEWISYKKAKMMLTYKNESKILEEAFSIFKNRII